MAQERMTEAFFEVDEHWQIAYQWRPARGPSNAPPIVFLNGLGDSYDSWAPYVEKFAQRDRLQVDLRGQGKAMQHRLKHDASSSFRISMQTQADDLAKLLAHLQIERVDLAAYSYGGGVAFDFATRYPEKTNKLALIVPFILRLDHSFPLQRLWSWQWNTARAFNLIPSALANGMENAYEKFLSAYMNQRYANRMSDPEHRRVAIDLTYGIMQFNAFDVVEKLPAHGVNLLTGDCDTLIPQSLFRELWRRLPEDKRGLWTRVPDGEHLLLEQKPQLVEQWLRATLEPTV